MAFRAGCAKLFALRYRLQRDYISEVSEIRPGWRTAMRGNGGLRAMYSLSNLLGFFYRLLIGFLRMEDTRKMAAAHSR